MTSEPPTSSDELEPDAGTERFVELLGSHERELFSYVFALAGSWDDAQEIMQRVRIRLWQQFSTYDDSRPFGAWGRAVAYYLVLAHRKEKSRDRVFFSERVMELLDETFQQQPDQLRNDRRDALLSCLEGLRRDHRQLISRFYTREEGIAEVARQLGMQANALRQSVFRIRKSLWGCIQRKLQSVT